MVVILTSSRTPREKRALTGMLTPALPPRRRNRSELAHQAECVVAAPVLDDLAVGDAHDVNPGHLDPRAGRRMPKKSPSACPASSSRDNFVALRDEIVDPPLQVGEERPRKRRTTAVCPSRPCRMPAGWCDRRSPDG